MNLQRKTWIWVVLAAALMVCADVAQELKQGVVVEKVAKNSEAEKAGLKEGDLLLHWARGDAQGEIQSPFDLRQIETEQAPRGNVTINGLRGVDKQAWTLGPDSWGIKARPNLPEPLLASYREGREHANAAKPVEAADEWRALAKKIENSKPAWLCPWLLSQAAESFADARQWQEADSSYQDAVQQAGGAGSVIVAQLLRAWAVTYQKRNDGSNAEKYYQQAIAESRKASTENLATAAMINERGRVVELRGDLIEAEDYYRQALAIREKLAPQSLGVAGSTNNLGIIAAKRGDLGKADEYLRQALAIRKKLSPGSRDVAASLSNIGLAAWHRGDLAEAEEYHNQALAIEEKLAPESLGLAYSFNNLGLVAYERGDLAKAEKYYHQALSIEEKLVPNSLDLVTLLNNLGLVASQRGDLANAEEYYLQALSIKEKLAPESLTIAHTFVDLADVANDRGNPQKAEDYRQRAFVIRKRLAPESLDTSESFDSLGKIAFEHHDLAKAEEYFQQSLAIKQKVAPNSLFFAFTLEQLGDIAQSQGDLDKAEEYYRQALAIREKLAPESQDHAESLVTLAGIMHRRRQPEAAAQLFEQALNALESQTTHLGGSEEERADFRAKYAGFYKNYLDLLVEQKKTGLAFQVLERWRARTLLEMLTAAHVDIRTGGDPALLEREHSLQESITAKSNRHIRLLDNQHSEQQLAELDKEIKELLVQHDDVEGQIRENSPVYAALTQPQPLSAKEVQQQLLDANTLLLEYSLGEEHSYVFAVTPDSLIAYELPKQTEIDAVARPVYDILVARTRSEKGESGVQRMQRAARAEAQYPQTAAALSRMILGPVASLLQGKRLLVVSDGILQYIPFTALPSPGTESAFVPLVANHQIVNLPSASVLQVLVHESAGRPKPAKAVAVLADPVFSASDGRVKAGSKTLEVGAAAPDSLSGGVLLRSATEVGVVDGEMHLPRLLFSRQEAESILKEAPANESMKAVDFQANRVTATSPELAQYQIIHFATHGLLNSEHPELSGLVFSLVDQHGKPQDGFLQLTDIYNLNLPADMVVLSACETGLGKEIKGEGLVGITRGFMYAGASRVLASLWKVDDAGTAELMGRFYKGIFKDNLQPAAALQKAQVEMWKQKRWSSPYYWAGFVLQGQW